MNATEEDRAFYEAAEAAFIRRRGTPFLLSPTDFALLREWRALGVPIEAVEAGIDDAFTRREERSAVGRVNSLSYCRDAVLEAWERRADAARGKGEPGRGGTTADVRRGPRRALAPPATSAASRAARARRAARFGAAPRCARLDGVAQDAPRRSRPRSRASTAASPRSSTRPCPSRARRARRGGLRGSSAARSPGWTRRPPTRRRRPSCGAPCGSGSTCRA